MADRLTVAIGWLEQGHYDKVFVAVRDMGLELSRMAFAISHLCTTLPKDGFVVVVPHGSVIVSHDDVTISVASDEVKVVPWASVRPGQGTANEPTK